ncbi:Putative periplasmic protein, partial [Salmonella enterica subsp. enterica serovar Enteritidis]
VALVVPSSVPPVHHRWRYYPSVGDFATAGVYDRTAIFCCCGGDGTRESSCAGGDAV